MTEGLKFDQEKTRLELVPPEIVEAIGQIMGFGANKYGLRYCFSPIEMLTFLEEELEKCNVKTVKVINYHKSRDCVLSVIEGTSSKTDPCVNTAQQEEKSLLSHEECVDPAMTNTLKRRTQNTKEGNNKTIENGIVITIQGCENVKRNDLKTQNLKKETDKQKYDIDLIKEDLPDNQQHYFLRDKKINARSAQEILQNSEHTLIMILKQEMREDIFVVGATTDLECLETMFKALRKQYNICNNLQQISFSQNPEPKINLKFPGDFNWASGINYSRVVGALLRHLYAFIKGEVNDPESGKPHLWHAACNLAFLITFESQPEQYQQFNNLFYHHKKG